MGKSLIKLIIAVVVVIVIIAVAVMASKSGGKDSLNVSDLQPMVSAPSAALSIGTVDTSKQVDGHHLVAANENYELYLYEPALSIIVKNTKTGAVMESTVRNEERLGNVNETWKGFCSLALWWSCRKRQTQCRKNWVLREVGRRLASNSYLVDSTQSLIIRRKNLALRWR